jgi:hypothetical protein
VILAHQYDAVMRTEKTPAAIERLVRWKRSMGFEAEHLLLNHSMMEGAVGGDDAKAYLFRNRHGFREDWLGRYLPVATRHGLRVIAYFNVHWFKTDTFPMEFYCLDSAGKPKVAYGSGYGVCPRGPFLEWAEELAEDLGRYPIAGVFLDGPGEDSCWCAACRAKFRARYGAELPASAAACPPELAAAFADFPREEAVTFTRDFARGLRRHNPEAILYCNGIADGGDGRSMAATADVTNFVGAEGGFIGYRPLSGVFPFNAGLAAKVLEARAAGRGRVIFSDCGFKKFDYHAHPKGEIARMYAGTIANGASPWFLVLRHAAGTEGVRTAVRFNRLIRENRAALTDGGSLAEAALVHSPVNLGLAGKVEGGSGDDVARREAAAGRIAVPRHFGEFKGLYAALARSGYPFDVLEESNLLAPGGIPGRIRLLILPGLGAVSDELAGKLRGFVRGGGRVLATFDTSLFDADGRRRADYALADVFGASADGELLGPSSLDYLAATGTNQLTRGVSQPVLPCPEYWWRVKAAKSARALLFYHEKMSRRYAALTAVSKSPAALVNRFGRGQAVFIPSALGDHCLNFRFPDERRLIANAARMLAPPPVELSAGDEFVETALRRGADGSLALHLVNWASGERPATRAIPLGPLEVTLRLPAGFRPRAARLAWAGRAARLSVRGRLARLTVPRLEEYELAVLR